MTTPAPSPVELVVLRLMPDTGVRPKARPGPNHHRPDLGPRCSWTRQPHPGQAARPRQDAEGADRHIVAEFARSGDAGRGWMVAWEIGYSPFCANPREHAGVAGQKCG